jgi:hypothetical protein
MACNVPEIRIECFHSTNFKVLHCICLLDEECYGGTHARLEVLTAVLLQIKVFCDIVTDVWKDRAVFIFKIKQYKDTLPDLEYEGSMIILNVGTFY